MSFNREVMNRIREADVVLFPKGENRKPVEKLFADNGMQVPEFAGRCLHLRG